MAENSEFFEYKNAKIHYSSRGYGSEILISFHGYGQSNHTFTELDNVLGDKYTIYSFDLFYHGQSFWHAKEKPLTKIFWTELMQAFFKEKNISKFSLMGFSMGGKFALATLEQFTPMVEELILIAPDGIKTSFWYSLATYPKWFRKLFRSIVLRPKLYYQIVKVLHHLRLLDKKIIRFANNQMVTREQRRRVYYSWVVFRELKFDLKKIAFLINQNNIKLEMFLGQYDKIITLKNMQKFVKTINRSEIFMLPAGHSNLIPAVAEFFKSKHEK